MKATSGRVKAMIHGFHRPPAGPKARIHGFYVTRPIPKARIHGFHATRPIPKARIHGFHATRLTPKARIHGFHATRSPIRSKTLRPHVRLTHMQTNDPHAPSLTAHQLLAAEIMRDLEAVAAKIPYLESPHPSKAAFVRSHGNVPIPFLQTATAAVEQTSELQAVKKLDPAQGHDTLQFAEAFRPVIDHVFALGRRLRFTVASRRARLAFQSLQIYAIAQSMARKDPNIAAHVANLRRDLGPRGRPRKARP
jgi:hypothetical protein